MYSAGATIDLVRICLAEKNAHQGWIAATDDIKTAFLRAPIPDLPNGRKYAMEPPKAMIRAGLAEPGELWLATAAVYGFQRSPKWWSEHGNVTTASARWRSANGGEMRIVPCVTDENLHKLVEIDSSGRESIVGDTLFYVDDTLAVGPPEYVHGFFDWLEATWETSGREVVSKATTVRFLGLELSMTESGNLKIAQPGYIDELLRKRQVTGFSKVPFMKEWATDEIPENVDTSPELIKEAQQRCGEILWTTQRTRPDAAYAAMMMARLTTRWPERAIQIAKKILCYYNATKDAAFVVEPYQEAKLVLYTDASHSPASTKSISGSLVLWKGVAICWRAANQSLTALSSAEAELIALSEGAQLLRSVKTTLEDMGIRPEMCELRVDATAAIAVASSGGSWRTRHLRLREHWLSELVNSDEYQLMHQPGLHQLADGLTKQLTSERVWKLMEAWSFFKGNSSEMKKVTINVAPSDEAAAASIPQATAATTSQESSIATIHTHEGTLGRCLRALIGLGTVAGVLGAESGGSQVYTGVDSDYELWVAVILVMITTVLCWEWSKKTAGGVKRAIKLKMLSSSTGKQKLSKSEGKELLSLLNKGDRSAEQDARLATLIGIFQAQGGLHSDGDSTSVGREGSSSKPTSTTLSTKERFQPEKWSRGVQTDPEPRVPPQAVQKSAVDAGIRYIVQPWEDDLYVSPNGDRIHLKPNCHGLRHAVRTVRKPICQYCLHDWRNHPANGGSSSGGLHGLE